jgi:hypothetical protein
MTTKTIPPKVGQSPLTLEFLERNPRVRAKRVFALVLFGDTTRFRRWRSRPFLSAEKHARFMIALYDTFIRFRNGSGYFVKLLADGLMSVLELPDGNQRSRAALEMMISANELVKSVRAQIKQMDYPRPDGFRIRMAAGHVLKLEASHPLDKTKIQVDYVEYAVDMTFGLLGVEKESPCICHETVREIVEDNSKAKALVKFEKVKRPAVGPEGIDPEDLDVLWSYRILKKPKMA